MLRIAIAISAALSLAACAPMSAAPETRAAPVIMGADAPSSPADLQDATILEVDRYRPVRILPACDPQPLPRAAAPAGLAQAIEDAQAYSDAEQGKGLMVMHNGTLVHADFTPGIDASTPFASASMAKSVLGLVVGIALEKGVIGSLEDRAGDYLVEWADDPRGEITVRQLLTMTSGLAPSDFTAILFSPDVTAAALRTPLEAEPGTVFSYNNAVSQIIGTIIDRQAKEAGYDGYAGFLERELWCPLGNGEAQLWIDQTGMARTYAGLHAGLADYLRIGELIRNKGRKGERHIVPAAWIEAMTTASAVNTQYGLQVWLGGGWSAQRRYSASNPLTVPHREPFAAPDVVFFDGFGGQRVYVIPSRGLTIARMGFTNLQYDDSIIPNTIIRAVD